MLNTLDDPSGDKFRQETEKRFGLTAHLATRETDVLLLQAKNTGQPGFPRTSADPQGSFSQTTHRGEMQFRNAPLTVLASRLEAYLNVPVLDRTGLSGQYDMTLRWNQPVGEPNRQAIRQAVVDELGLELVPRREPIEMLVVEKTK